MNIDFLTDFYVPVIVGICLCVGYIVKKWIKDVENKWIPTINAVLGLVLALAMNWGSFSPDVLLSGLVSGLAATGLYEAFKNLIEKKE